jgi:hypothetical protein
MLHTCVERFDVMGERENILGWDGEVNKALVKLWAALAPPYISAKESFSTNVSLHGDKLIIFFWKRMYIYLYHHREAKSDGCTQVKLIVWNFYAPEPHNTEWAAMSVWAHLANQTDPDRPAIGPVWHGRGQAHGHFLRLRRPSRSSLVLLVDPWRCGTRMPQHVAWPCGGGLLRILPGSSKTQNAVLVLLGYVFTC